MSVMHPIRKTLPHHLGSTMPQIASKNLRILHHYLNRLLRNQAMLSNTNCAEIALKLCQGCTRCYPKGVFLRAVHDCGVLTTLLCPTGCLWHPSLSLVTQKFVRSARHCWELSRCCCCYCSAVGCSQRSHCIYRRLIWEYFI